MYIRPQVMLWLVITVRAEGAYFLLEGLWSAIHQLLIVVVLLLVVYSELIAQHTDS